jgi:hypothetical protein
VFYIILVIQRGRTGWAVGSDGVSLVQCPLVVLGCWLIRESARPALLQGRSGLVAQVHWLAPFEDIVPSHARLQICLEVVEQLQ